jgi:hypothetical protein
MPAHTRHRAFGGMVRPMTIHIPPISICESFCERRKYVSSFFRGHLRTRARAIVRACLCACVYLQSHGYTAAATQLVALSTALRLCRVFSVSVVQVVTGQGAATRRRPPPAATPSENTTKEAQR